MKMNKKVGSCNQASNTAQTTEKPQIIIEFTDNECRWISVGWKDNEELMKEAKRIINASDDKDEIIRLLGDKFRVVETWWVK